MTGTLILTLLILLIQWPLCISVTLLSCSQDWKSSKYCSIHEVWWVRAWDADLACLTPVSSSISGNDDMVLIGCTADRRWPCQGPGPRLGRERAFNYCLLCFLVHGPCFLTSPLSSLHATEWDASYFGCHSSCLRDGNPPSEALAVGTWGAWCWSQPIPRMNHHGWLRPGLCVLTKFVRLQWDQGFLSDQDILANGIW